ncbi:MAG: monovalent cation/H(+) antiporter subunit G [Paracoccus sp. (in: a-proteobacteria)]|uniref:monovalent cation/H(+) antiporter subunit G n=1 Tax=Paracoccus sp. TaxID=267 RepID=UPI0026E09D5B|nr:monovalent cation/H(+) antiporter subunit G [Paracoccus sp. (in: a-proteobacteria)]MDO5620293.1 monovalent cation/H(+) antiporter subunit G [Paracoccus sp. (in: a-proteobacteria)]
MTDLASLPPIIAIAAAILLVIGSTLTLLGNIGLVRFRSFYQRLHAPTLGTSWGTAAVFLASMLIIGQGDINRAISDLTIGIFVMITMPIALLILGRTALRRQPPKTDTLPDEALDPPLDKDDHPPL